MAKRKDIEITKPTVEGLAMMARELGYKSRFAQLSFNNGATASDLFDFFEDNPGACEAVIEWVLESGRDRELNFLEEDEDEDEDEDENSEIAIFHCIEEIKTTKCSSSSDEKLIIKYKLPDHL